MQKQRLILIIGIVLALIAILMVKAYIDQQVEIRDKQRKRTVEQQLASAVSVLVAKQDISRGAIIDAQMLEPTVVPRQFVQPQAVTSLDRIADMIVIAPISKGEQITLSKLSYQQGQGGSLAMATPVGKRAITVSVDNLSSLAGMIKPGDYVDVIAMVPVPVQTVEGKQVTQAAVIPLFQNVLVLAVGQEIGVASRAQLPESRYKQPVPEKKEASSLITVALSPQESNLIAFVQEQGKIRLVLRSPADSQIHPVQPASWDTLFQYVMPKEAVTKPPEPEPPADTYVEIYRGLKKERVPLIK